MSLENKVENDTAAKTFTLGEIAQNFAAFEGVLGSLVITEAGENDEV